MIRFRLFQGEKQTLQEQETKAIRDILVGIRILGSESLTNGSGPAPDTAYYFLEVHFHHSSQIKSHQEVTKQ